MPNASLKVGFLLREDKTREDSTFCRIFNIPSRSIPLREATLQNTEVSHVALLVLPAPFERGQPQRTYLDGHDGYASEQNQCL